MALCKGNTGTHKYVVLSVRDGINFAYLSNRILRILASFEETAMSSQSVYITPVPTFNCNFIWHVENEFLDELLVGHPYIIIELRAEYKHREEHIGFATIAVREAQRIISYDDSLRFRSLEIKGVKRPFGIRDPEIFVSLTIQTVRRISYTEEWHSAELDDPAKHIKPSSTRLYLNEIKRRQREAQSIYMTRSSEDTVSYSDTWTVVTSSQNAEESEISKTPSEQTVVSEKKKTSSKETVVSEKKKTPSEETVSYSDTWTVASSSLSHAKNQETSESKSSDIQTTKRKDNYTKPKTPTESSYESIPYIETSGSYSGMSPLRVDQQTQTPGKIPNMKNNVYAYWLETIFGDPNAPPEQKTVKVSWNGQIVTDYEDYADTNYPKFKRKPTPIKKIEYDSEPEIQYRRRSKKNRTFAESGTQACFDPIIEEPKIEDSPNKDAKEKGATLKTKTYTEGGNQASFDPGSKAQHGSSKDTKEKAAIPKTKVYAQSGTQVSTAIDLKGSKAQHSSNKDTKEKGAIPKTKVYAQSGTQVSTATDLQGSKVQASSTKHTKEKEVASKGKVYVQSGTQASTVTDLQGSQVQKEKGAASKAKIYAQSGTQASQTQSGLNKDTKEKGATSRTKIYAESGTQVSGATILQGSQIKPSKDAKKKGGTSTTKICVESGIQVSLDTNLQGSPSKDTRKQGAIKKVYSNKNENWKTTHGAVKHTKQKGITAKLSYDESGKKKIKTYGNQARFDKNLAPSKIIPTHFQTMYASIHDPLSLYYEDDDENKQTERTTITSGVWDSPNLENSPEYESPMYTGRSYEEYLFRDDPPITHTKLKDVQEPSLMDYIRDIPTTSPRYVSEPQVSKRKQIPHVYKIELRFRKIEWFEQQDDQKVLIKFYNPHINTKTAIEDREYNLPDLRLSDVVCGMYYVTTINDLLEVVTNEPPQMLIYKERHKVIAKGAVQVASLRKVIKPKTYESYLPIINKKDRTIALIHVFLTFEDMGIIFETTVSSLKCFIRYEVPSPDKRTRKETGAKYEEFCFEQKSIPTISVPEFTTKYYDPTIRSPYIIQDLTGKFIVPSSDQERRPTTSGKHRESSSDWETSPSTSVKYKTTKHRESSPEQGIRPGTSEKHQVCQCKECFPDRERRPSTSGKLKKISPVRGTRPSSSEKHKVCKHRESSPDQEAKPSTSGKHKVCKCRESSPDQKTRPSTSGKHKVCKSRESSPDQETRPSTLGKHKTCKHKKDLPDADQKPILTAPAVDITPELEHIARIHEKLQETCNKMNICFAKIVNIGVNNVLEEELAAQNKETNEELEEELAAQNRETNEVDTENIQQKEPIAVNQCIATTMPGITIIDTNTQTTAEENVPKINETKTEEGAKDVNVIKASTVVKTETQSKGNEVVENKIEQSKDILWCEFCKQFHLVTKIYDYITAIEPANPDEEGQHADQAKFPKLTINIGSGDGPSTSGIQSKKENNLKPNICENVKQPNSEDNIKRSYGGDASDTKSNKPRNVKTTGVQTIKPSKPREMAYIPKPAITVIKHPCQGCDQYLEVGFGQRVWQDESLTFWCKDCYIKKLQSDIKETMQSCSSQVSDLKNQLVRLESNFANYVVNSVSKDDYDHLTTAQHNLTMLFTHAKHQNDYLHTQCAKTAQKLQELKQLIPYGTPRSQITETENQFRKDNEQMKEIYNRVRELMQEIDEYRNKDITKQNTEDPKEKKAIIKPVQQSVPKLSARRERCIACRVLEDQAKAAEEKKVKTAHASAPLHVRFAGITMKKDEVPKVKAPKERSTYCQHELSKRMTDVSAKLQYYLDERDALVRVNRYTCNNVIVAHMTKNINRLLVEWDELKTEYEKLSQ